ncbi:Hypothetical predicted protein [Mytilus galloprovincialis]|uniref:Attractin/MKLN-like beta-propeller domain-containing protein n=2 Tax=Mytilus galloprovincialis TaxID=29158 RepID=A0A8B6H1Q9_MYTGA|nr:Hypothetical predicted protein [Mytilus galloprovincialis]
MIYKMNNMKLLITIAILTPSIQTADIDIVWHGGEKTANVSATEMSPGSRAEGGLWFDDSTKSYLFGGWSYNSVSKEFALTNDLWVLDVNTFHWSILKPVSKNKPSPRYSPSICGIPSRMIVIFGGIDQDGKKLHDTWIYNILDNSWEELMLSGNSSTSSHPPGRGHQSSWCTSTKLIIFGGRNAEHKALHDMWSFSLVNQKWSEMESSKKYPSNSFGQTIVSYPKPRSGATTFHQGSLYLFGGNTAVIDSGETNIDGKYANDLWSYDIGKDSWTKIGGFDNVCHHGYYGHFQVAGKDNWPGCRVKATGWVDTNGNLWMFGGDGSDSTAESVTVFKPGRLLNDLWRYEFVFKMWSWMGGNKYGNTGGKYGESSSERYPGSRTGFMSFNRNHNFHHIFGGMGHDTNGQDGLLSDLWEIDVHKEVVYGKYPTTSNVFMIIFGLCGLILLIVALSLYNRKFFRGSEKEKDKMSDTEYCMLTNIDDED